MKLDILYFGLIAEAISINYEELIISNIISINDLKNQLISKHPILEKLEYQIAINQKIASQETLINKDSEVALLPPFAGG